MNSDTVPEQTDEELLALDVSDEALEAAAAPTAAATGDPFTRSAIC
jgi:hypothetical protein